MKYVLMFVETEEFAADLAAMGEVDLFHATRAELLRDLGHDDPARAADERALTLTANPAERSLLRQRLNWM
jgi:predicted RNA polymerase sigma factor